MPSAASRASAIVRAILALVCIITLIFVALLGGFLNRGRGGFITFGPKNSSNSVERELWYWPEHVLSRLLLALPTGLFVFMCSLHLRASFVVMIMTWFSLYVGWGCYMNIGMANNVKSRSGVFDWFLGRQVANWTLGHRFVREYVGMSLRGLIWTAPQGYILEQLGFGWEYSLSGSLMGLVYYAGGNTDTSALPHQPFFNQGIPASEVYWGWWMWFVLSVISLSQLVRRTHIYVYQRNPYLGTRPYSSWESIKYLSLNRPFLRLTYEIFMSVFNILLCGSLVFYSLVQQADIRNKAQTVFGLFTAILVLCFSQGWVWSLLFQKFRMKRFARKIPDPELAQSNNSQLYGIRQSLSRSGNDYQRSYGNSLVRYEGTSTPMNGETRPLLSWPYSHPDRVSPTGERINTLKLPEGNPSVSRHVQHVIQSPSSSNVLITWWPSLDKWLWLDVFVVLRRTVGLAAILSTLLTIILTVVAIVWDSESPRFMHDPSIIFVINTTTSEL